MMLGANNIIKTKRLVKTSGHESYPAEYYLTDIVCYCENPVTEYVTVEGEQIAFIKFKLHTDVVDIIETDQITDQQGNDYTVSYVQSFINNTDTDNHLEIVAYKKAL